MRLSTSLYLGPDGLQGRERPAFFPATEHLLGQQPLHGRPIVPFRVPAAERALQAEGDGFFEPGIAVLFAQFADHIPQVGQHPIGRGIHLVAALPSSMRVRAGGRRRLAIQRDSE